MLGLFSVCVARRRTDRGIRPRVEVVARPAEPSAGLPQRRREVVFETEQREQASDGPGRSRQRQVVALSCETAIRQQLTDGANFFPAMVTVALPGGFEVHRASYESTVKWTVAPAGTVTPLQVEEVLELSLQLKW